MHIYVYAILHVCVDVNGEYKEGGGGAKRKISTVPRFFTFN